jgi:hypothetical protein
MAVGVVLADADQRDLGLGGGEEVTLPAEPRESGAAGTRGRRGRESGTHGVSRLLSGGGPSKKRPSALWPGIAADWSREW